MGLLKLSIYYSDFINGVCEHYDARHEIKSIEIHYKSKAVEVSKIYESLIRYASAYDMIGELNFTEELRRYDESVISRDEIEKVNPDGNFVQYSEDGFVVYLYPLRANWDFDTHIIKSFEKILSAHYRPPEDILKLISHLFVFFKFYNDVAPKLPDSSMMLLHYVDLSFTRAATTALKIMAKIKWRDARYKFSQPKATESKKYGDGAYGKILKEIWNDLPERNKKLKPYTLAKKMRDIWNGKYSYQQPKDDKTIVKYIKEFRRED
jgi:hypothetical protein